MYFTWLDMLKSSSVPARRRLLVGRRLRAPPPGNATGDTALRHLTTSNCRPTRRRARATTFHVHGEYLLVDASTQTNRDRRFDGKYPKNKHTAKNTILPKAHIFVQAGEPQLGHARPRATCHGLP